MNHSRRPQPKTDTATKVGSAHVALARHGETVWHSDNRYAGADSDIDLTPKGQRQARDLARWCAGFAPDAVISSPVRRAVETARPCAEASGAQLLIVDGLREVSFGVGDGHTIEELLQLDPAMVHRFRADPAAHPFPGAEPPQDAADRAASALRIIAEQYSGAKVLVVAHNTLLRLAICRLLSLPVARYRDIFPRLDNAAITQMSIPVQSDRVAALLCLNVPVRGGPDGSAQMS